MHLPFTLLCLLFRYNLLIQKVVDLLLQQQILPPSVFKLLTCLNQLVLQVLRVFNLTAHLVIEIIASRCAYFEH